MRVRAKMALGVEVSSTQVCMALVRRDRRRLVLVRAARAALPPEMIQDSRVTDPAALAKVLVDLKGRCKGRPDVAGVSLSGSSVRLQILELPNPLPANVSAFVQNEVKQSMSLVAGQIVSDHCGVASNGPRRLLAAAADGGRVLAVVEACERARLGVDIVEPSLLATIRGLYAKKIGGTSGCSVLLASLRENALEICVFKGGHLDFVRALDLADVWTDAEALGKRLSQEIRAVVQYYDVEVADTCEAWQIAVLVEDGVALPDKAASKLKPRGSRAEVDIVTAEQAALALGVECDDPAVLAGASPAAVGLALRLVGQEDGTPGVNLLPAQVSQKRVVRRHALIAAACTAGVLVVMALAGIGLRFKIESVWSSLGREREKVADSFAEVVSLVAQQRQMDAQIERVSKEHGQLGKILQSQHQVDWPGVLGDIRDVRPQSLHVTRLTSRESEKPELLIDGFSFNYGAVSLFTNKLNQSGHITSATVVKSGQESANGRTYFVYQIRCTL